MDSELVFPPCSCSKHKQSHACVRLSSAHLSDQIAIGALCVPHPRPEIYRCRPAGHPIESRVDKQGAVYSSFYPKSL